MMHGIRSRTHAGFSYVEVLLAVTILAGSVLSMGHALQSTRDVEADLTLREQADYLLEDGIAWVQILERSEPDIAPSNFGVDSGESWTDFDDVDDLDGFMQRPPVDQAGQTYDSDWARTFTVESVDPDDPDVAVTDGSTNLMRVTVAVLHDSTTITSETLLLWRPQ